MTGVIPLRETQNLYEERRLRCLQVRSVNRVGFAFCKY